MQAASIHNWQPWNHSTGPKSFDGKAKVARNSWKGGKRPAFRHTMRELQEALRSLRLYEQVEAMPVVVNLKLTWSIDVSLTDKSG